jgi:hypothetical protein
MMRLKLQRLSWHQNCQFPVKTWQKIRLHKSNTTQPEHYIRTDISVWNRCAGRDDAQKIWPKVGDTSGNPGWFT